jgi:hypothetical protein
MQKMQKSLQIPCFTRTAWKYHRDGCRYAAASKITISLKDAKKYTQPARCAARPSDGYPYSQKLRELENGYT